MRFLTHFLAKKLSPATPRIDPPALRKPEPRFAPEMIVCPARLIRELRPAVQHQGHIRLVGPFLRDISGSAPLKITVLPGVDLDENLHGEGTLREILRCRQLVWGDRAVFIDLTRVSL